METFEHWRDRWEGIADDIDRVNGVQCADAFKRFCMDYCGEHWACGGDGYVWNFWKYKDVQPTAKYFDYVYTIEDVQSGDWVVWGAGSRDCPLSHIAMYVKDGTFPKGVFFGQQQSYDHSPYSYNEISWNGFLGAFRLKKHEPIELKPGRNDVTAGGRSYHVYKQKPGQKAGVLACGLNQVQGFTRFDAHALIMASAGGANYFQNRTDVPGQPHGMTFGDISAPMCDTFQELPGQKSTLFYDLDDHAYGTVEGKHLNPDHNVFSPAVVFHGDTFEYASMVGINHVNLVNNYAFVIGFEDGYAVGICDQQTTPREIWNDWKGVDGVTDLSVLDGGGSASLCIGWDVIRDTGRRIPSVVAIYEEYEDDCPTCKIDYEDAEEPGAEPEPTPEEEEEPDGPGATAELLQVAEILKRLEDHEKRISRLENE